MDYVKVSNEKKKERTKDSGKYQCLLIISLCEFDENPQNVCKFKCINETRFVGFF